MNKVGTNLDYFPEIRKMSKTNKTTDSPLLSLIKDIRYYDNAIYKNERATLEQTVSYFKSKNTLFELVNLVLNDPYQFNNILDKSYRHQNGFHKIVIAEGALFKLRLHIFEKMPEIQVPMENIHNHRWNFASHILKGSLKMEIYEKSDHGRDVFFDYDYNPSKQGNKYEVNLCGVTKLKLRSERIYSSGDTYYMNNHELHRIVNSADQKVETMVMTGMPTNSNCKLYSQHVFSEGEKLVLKYTRSELINLFENL